MFTDNAYFNKSVRIISRYYKQIIEDKYDKYILSQLFVTYKKYNKIPSIDDILLNIQNNPKLTNDNFEKLTARLTEIKEMSYDLTIDNLLDETSRFVKESLSAKMAEEIIDSMTNEDKTLDHSDTLVKMEEIVGINFDANLGLSGDDKSTFEKYSSERTSLGVEVIDNLIGGGIPNDAFMVLLAAVHVGKTQFAIFFAYLLALRGKKVLLFITEMGDTWYKHRLDSLVLNIDTFKLDANHMSFKEYEELISKHDEVLARIRIIDMSNITANMDSIEEVVIENKKAGFEANFIMYDSLNQFSPSGGAKGEEWQQLAKVSVETKKRAKKLNIPMFGTWHMDNGSEMKVKGGEDITGNFFANAKSVYRDIDIGIGIKSVYMDKLDETSSKLYKDKLCLTAENDILYPAIVKNCKFYVKINCFKNRFPGENSVEHIILGTNPSVCNYYDPITGSDINASSKLSRDNDHNITTEDDENSNEHDLFSAGRKKRTTLTKEMST